MKDPKNTILIEIFTTDNLLDAELRNSFGEQVSPFCEASLTDKEETATSPDSITLRLEYVVSPITTSTISHWLTEKIQGRSEKLRIDRQELPIQEEDIKEAIEEMTVKREAVGKRSQFKEQ